MKIVLLVGAYKNAGDFLIAKRSQELLERCYPNSTITVYRRNVSLERDIDFINQQECLVIGGGPAYEADMYPGSIKLTSNLEDIKIPIVSLGLGWWGQTPSYKELEAHQFKKKSVDLLHRMAKEMPLSCRDWETYNVVKNSGFEARMTGCVAWYVNDYIDQISIKDNCKKSNTICVSDPAQIKNYRIVLQLIEYLQKKYPDKKIVFVFHRGSGKTDEFTDSKVAQCQRTLKEELGKRDVECVDISYGDVGFKVYDNCFMHIGFRVHAHIYNLSIRQVSLLIEEDARGYGVNHALGLPSIKAYNYFIPKKVNRLYNYYMQKYNCNEGVMKEIEYIFRELDYTKKLVYEQAFSRMKVFYKEMISHIQKIEKII